MKTIEVYPVGSKLEIHKGVTAVVTGVCLEGSQNRVTYRCAWWDGNTRVTEWFDSFEVEWTEGADKIQIGFSMNGLAS